MKKKKDVHVKCPLDVAGSDTEILDAKMYRSALIYDFPFIKWTKNIEVLFVRRKYFLAGRQDHITGL